MTEHSKKLHRPVVDIIRKDAATLHQNITVQQALVDIRQKGLGDRIVYFYVVDGDGRLVGVLPTRRLLISPLDQRISGLMIASPITISQHATVLDAYELFLKHKFLAFPVVDDGNHLLGVVDIGMFTEDAIELADYESRDRVFELIGLHIMEVQKASPTSAFRFRFPWLLATITSGTVCALLVGAYEITLAKSLILAFFLTLVLGLGESVSMQSMTTTIHNLHAKQPDWIWYLQTLRHEGGAALLLGAACGLVVGLIAWLWRGNGVAAFVIGGSITLTLCVASFLGLSIPSLLHKLKLDLKIAAGPLTLALTDIFTILIYFSLATVLL